MNRRVFFWVSLVLCVVGSMMIAPNRLIYCLYCILGGTVTAIADKIIFGIES